MAENKELRIEIRRASNNEDWQVSVHTHGGAYVGNPYFAITATKWGAKRIGKRLLLKYKRSLIERSEVIRLTESDLGI